MTKLRKNYGNSSEKLSSPTFIDINEEEIELFEILHKDKLIPTNLQDNGISSTPEPPSVNISVFEDKAARITLKSGQKIYFVHEDISQIEDLAEKLGKPIVRRENYTVSSL
jgi:hypothetical protein